MPSISVFGKVVIMALSGIMNFFMPISAAIDPNCDYYQNVELGQQYYLYNREYPSNYPARTSCRWVAHSAGNTRMILSCEDIDIPASTSCSGDRLSVALDGNQDFVNARTYCGKGTISVVSDYNDLAVGLFSTWYSTGGKFLCSLTAVQSDETTTTPKPPTCDCGWKYTRRIVGGQETGVNEYPAMAALVDTTIRDLYCGASIIASRYALTAAHCARDPSIVGLLVGEHDITTGSDTDATALYRVASITRHPQFDSNTLENDIAVVKTTEEILFSTRVGPTCLPFRYSTESFEGLSVTALGWGTTEFSGPKSDTLQAVNLSVVSNLRCATELPDNVIGPSQICTFAPGKDSCQSDSGGPLYLYHNGRLLQVGIISYGLSCATDIPSVNVRVTSYLTWIVSVTNDATYCIK